MKSIFLNNRIRFILSFFFVFCASTVTAQQPVATSDDEQFLEKCAVTFIEQKQIDQLGVYGTREYFEVWLKDRKREIQRSPYRYRTQADGKRQIPVVVHVIHNGTPVGQGANIPLSQIQAQIDILNEDYTARIQMRTTPLMSIWELPQQLTSNLCWQNKIRMACQPTASIEWQVPKVCTLQMTML